MGTVELRRDGYSHKSWILPPCSLKSSSPWEENGLRPGCPVCDLFIPSSPSPPLQQLLTKQDSLDIYNERDLFKTEEPTTEEEEESAGDGERTLDGELDLLEQDPLVPPPPSQAPLSAERVAFPKGLPWAPKVR